MTSTRSENSIQKACLQYLSTLRGGFFWRCNTGAFAGEYKGKKRFVRYGVTGQPDIQGIYDGRWVGFEVKRPGEDQNKNQKVFEQFVIRAGGFYRVIRSVDECVAAIKELEAANA